MYPVSYSANKNTPLGIEPSYPLGVTASSGSIKQFELTYDAINKVMDRLYDYEMKENCIELDCDNESCDINNKFKGLCPGHFAAFLSPFQHKTIAEKTIQEEEEEEDDEEEEDMDQRNMAKGKKPSTMELESSIFNKKCEVLLQRNPYLCYFFSGIFPSRWFIPEVTPNYDTLFGFCMTIFHNIIPINQYKSFWTHFTKLELNRSNYLKNECKFNQNQCNIDNNGGNTANGLQLLIKQLNFIGVTLYTSLFCGESLKCSCTSEPLTLVGAKRKGTSLPSISCALFTIRSLVGSIYFMNIWFPYLTSNNITVRQLAIRIVFKLYLIAHLNPVCCSYTQLLSLKCADSLYSIVCTITNRELKKEASKKRSNKSDKIVLEENGESVVLDVGDLLVDEDFENKIDMQEILSIKHIILKLQSKHSSHRLTEYFNAYFSLTNDGSINDQHYTILFDSLLQLACDKIIPAEFITKNNSDDITFPLEYQQLDLFQCPVINSILLPELFNGIAMIPYDGVKTISLRNLLSGLLGAQQSKKDTSNEHKLRSSNVDYQSIIRCPKWQHLLFHIIAEVFCEDELKASQIHPSSSDTTTSKNSGSGDNNNKGNAKSVMSSPVLTGITNTGSNAEDFAAADLSSTSVNSNVLKYVAGIFKQIHLFAFFDCSSSQFYQLLCSSISSLIEYGGSSGLHSNSGKSRFIEIFLLNLIQTLCQPQNLTQIANSLNASHLISLLHIISVTLQIILFQSHNTSMPSSPGRAIADFFINIREESDENKSEPSKSASVNPAAAPINEAEATGASSDSANRSSLTLPTAATRSARLSSGTINVNTSNNNSDVNLFEANFRGLISNIHTISADRLSREVLLLQKLVSLLDSLGFEKSKFSAELFPSAEKQEIEIMTQAVHIHAFLLNLLSIFSSAKANDKSSTTNLTSLIRSRQSNSLLRYLKSIQFRVSSHSSSTFLFRDGYLNTIGNDGKMFTQFYELSSTELLSRNGPSQAVLSRLSINPSTTITIFSENKNISSHFPDCSQLIETSIQKAPLFCQECEGYIFEVSIPSVTRSKQQNLLPPQDFYFSCAKAKDFNRWIEAFCYSISYSNITNGLLGQGTYGLYKKSQQLKLPTSVITPSYISLTQLSSDIPASGTTTTNMNSPKSNNPNNNSVEPIAVKSKRGSIVVFQDKSLVSVCGICECKFGLLKRKYNCQDCGLVFCDSCCDNRLDFPDPKDNNKTIKARACKNCVK